jgi:hypothetical protein
MRAGDEPLYKPWVLTLLLSVVDAVVRASVL